MFKRSLYSVSIRGAEVSLHFQGWLLQIIYGSFTYKLDCCNTGGLKTWGHSANLHLCAFTLEHSVQGSLPWCPLTIPWVQCSAEAFTNRKGTAVVCEKCDLQYGRAWMAYAWMGFGGRTLMFSQKLILDIVLERPDWVSVSDYWIHCLWISVFPSLLSIRCCWWECRSGNEHLPYEGLQTTSARYKSALEAVQGSNVCMYINWTHAYLTYTLL